MHHGGGGGAGGGYGHGHGAHHGGHHASHHHHGGEPSQSLSWNMAMQADSFWVKLLKANQKPIVVVVLGTAGLVLWLNFIHYVHGKEDPNHVVASEIWNQQLTAANPHQAPTAADPSINSAPQAFGAPRSESDGSAVGQGMGGNASGMPSLAPMMFSHYMPGGYSPSQASAMPMSLGAPSGAGQGLASATGLAMPQQQQLFPARNHAAQRYRMVVSR